MSMFGKRPAPKKRAQRGVLAAANIDPEGLDPEMAETLSQESARRLGAAGVQVQTKNPVGGLGAKLKSLMKPKKKSR